MGCGGNLVVLYSAWVPFTLTIQVRIHQNSANMVANIAEIELMFFTKMGLLLFFVVFKQFYRKK